MNILMILIGVALMVVLAWLYAVKKRNFMAKGPYQKDIKHWKHHKQVFEETIKEYMSVLRYAIFRDYSFKTSDFNENVTVYCDQQKTFNDLKHLMVTRVAGIKQKFHEKIKSNHDDLIKTEITELGPNAIQIDYMTVSAHKLIFSANLIQQPQQEMMDNKQ